MTLRQFIKKHRDDIDSCIARAMHRTVSELPYRNDRERRLWILNDEGLYQWAQSEGVQI